jgi:hypothetical protein
VEALLLKDLVQDTDYIIELTDTRKYLSLSLAGQGKFAEA